jgi:hypothetical protein
MPNERNNNKKYNICLSKEEVEFSEKLIGLDGLWNIHNKSKELEG